MQKIFRRLALPILLAYNFSSFAAGFTNDAMYADSAALTGTKDVVQLSVKAKQSQTAAIIDFTNYLGTTHYFTLASTGVLTLTQNLIAPTFTGNLVGNADTVTNGVYTSGSYSNPSWITALAGSKITGAVPLATLVTNGIYTTDTGTVTNTMLAGSIANNKLLNSSITINGNLVSLGGSTTITAGTTNPLTISSGLQLNTGSTWDGSVAKTLSVNYNATNLKITSSALNTIQDIATSSSPTFTALNSDYLSSKTANTDMQIGSGFGSSDTGALMLYTNGTGKITLQNGANTTANAIELTPLAGGVTITPALNKDITLSTSGTGVTSVSKLNLPNLTASYALVTDSSKNVGAIPYTTASTPLTIMQRSVTGSTSAQQVVLGADPSAAMEAATKQYVDAASTTGNAATATKLQTARAINGVNFDGSAAITVPAAAGTLTGATLASGVTASSLTSLGTLTGLAISSTGSVIPTITSTTTGSLNQGGIKLIRGDQANGYARVEHFTGATPLWSTGLRAGDNSYHIFDEVTPRDAITLTTTGATLAGNVQVTGALTTGNFTMQTYTPVLSDGTNNFTMSSQSGVYMVLGNMVWVNVRIVWSGKGSAVSTNGIQITLPFASVITGNPNIAFALGDTNGVGITTQRYLSAENTGSQSYVTLQRNTTGTQTGILVSDLSASGVISFTGWYPKA